MTELCFPLSIIRLIILMLMLKSIVLRSPLTKLPDLRHLIQLIRIQSVFVKRRNNNLSQQVRRQSCEAPATRQTRLRFNLMKFPLSRPANSTPFVPPTPPQTPDRLLFSCLIFSSQSFISCCRCLRPPIAVLLATVFHHFLSSNKPNALHFGLDL